MVGGHRGGAKGRPSLASLNFEPSEECGVLGGLDAVMPEELSAGVSLVIVMDKDGGPEAVAGVWREVKAVAGDGGLVDCLAFVAGDGERGVGPGASGEVAVVFGADVAPDDRSVMRLVGESEFEMLPAGIHDGDLNAVILPAEGIPFRRAVMVVGHDGTEEELVLGELPAELETEILWTLPFGRAGVKADFADAGWRVDVQGEGR